MFYTDREARIILFGLRTCVFRNKNSCKHIQAVPFHSLDYSLYRNQFLKFLNAYSYIFGLHSILRYLNKYIFNI